MDNVPTEFLEHILSFVPRGSVRTDKTNVGPASIPQHDDVQARDGNVQGAGSDGVSKTVQSTVPSELVIEAQVDSLSCQETTTRIHQAIPDTADHQFIDPDSDVGPWDHRTREEDRQPIPTLRPRYATVCKSWQIYFESLTFRRINLKGTDLTEFSRIVRGNRAAAVIWIQYDIVLPPYSRRQYSRFETDKDEAVNNAAFSDAIHGLFGILQSWEDETNLNSRLAAQYSGGMNQAPDGFQEWRNFQLKGLSIVNIHSPTDSYVRHGRLNSNGFAGSVLTLLQTLPSAFDDCPWKA